MKKDLSTGIRRHKFIIESNRIYFAEQYRNCLSSNWHRQNINDKSSKKSNAKILVVEDNPVIQRVNRSMLEAINCHVDIAVDGKEASALFNDSYNLIILDIGLPDMDGREVCKIIRKQQRKYTPIIAYTTCDTLEKECFEAGVDEFVVKPILKDGFKELLKKWLPYKSFEK